MRVPTILEDDREIMRIDWFDDEGSHFDVRSSCSKIIAYGEPAQHCDVPFFAVYNHSDEIICRVPAGAVSVAYR